MNSVGCCMTVAALGAMCVSVLGRLAPEQLAKLPAPAAQPVRFAQNIQPLLETRCLQCHGHGKAKGGFSLETRESLIRGGNTGPAVVPGKSAESYLIELVSGLDPDNVMPQKGSKLSPTQVGLLRAWIDQGLPWDAGFTFAKRPPLNLRPRQPELPPARPGVTHPIDRWLQHYFERHPLPAVAPVDDRRFARRVFLDVLGLLPSSAEWNVFLTDDSADKRERLVDRLLADDRRYAEHWLSFWNDALRNDYRGTGYIDGGRKTITGWLYSVLATNLPYDRFVAELVNPTPESEGFVRGIVWRGVINSSQSPEMQAAQNISQLFLGVNLKCASCHDSFINDWTLADAYGLASVYADKPLEMYHCDKPTGEKAVPRFLYPELGSIPADAPRAEKQKRLSEILTSPQNGRLSRTMVNRLWQRFLGIGLVEPVDDMEQAGWHPDLLDWLAEDLVSHGYNLKRTMKLILTSRAYQLPAVSLDEQQHAQYVFTGPAVRRMSAEQFRDALGTVTGVWYEKPAVTLDSKAGETRASLVAADPLTTALGRPPREQMTTRRPSAATTLQALELTNGETLAHLLKRGAKTIAGRFASSAEELVRALYLQGLGRPPVASELSLATQALGQPVNREHVEDFLWALAMLPEFQLIY